MVAGEGSDAQHGGRVVLPGEQLTRWRQCCGDRGPKLGHAVAIGQHQPEEAVEAADVAERQFEPQHLLRQGVIRRTSILPRFSHLRPDPFDLALDRSFTLDDAPEEIGHFLAEAGFVHLQGLFTEAEMAAVAADHDQAIAKAGQDDGASWWARTEEQGWYAARILGFNHQSPALREVLASERFAALAGFTDDRWAQRDFEAADAAEGLLKKVGVVEGASDVSWHKDCAPGGHSRDCCGMVVGISVTGAGPENGELGVVAGSHRANVVQLGIEGLDLPRLPLPTRTGDVTIHCPCTLHMSRPPISAERRVVYTGFGLAPRAGDHRVEVDPAEIRRQRAAQNDHARRTQRESQDSSLVASFDL